MDEWTNGWSDVCVCGYLCTRCTKHDKILVSNVIIPRAFVFASAAHCNFIDGMEQNTTNQRIYTNRAPYWSVYVPFFLFFSLVLNQYSVCQGAIYRKKKLNIELIIASASRNRLKLLFIFFFAHWFCYFNRNFSHRIHIVMF